SGTRMRRHIDVGRAIQLSSRREGCTAPARMRTALDDSFNSASVDQVFRAIFFVKQKTAYEMMLSESQERMLMVLRPEKEAEAEAIFQKWGLDFAIVGETTPTRRFIVRHHGAVMADLPIKELGDAAPVYHRPFTEPTKLPIIDAAAVVAPMTIADALERLIGSPDLCSKRWVWEQYDHIIL